MRNQKGQVLVEILVAMGIAAIILPTVFTGFITSREGKVQTEARLAAVNLAKEGAEAVRVAREADWANVATNGIYHPIIAGNTWTLSAGPETINKFIRSVTISDMTPADPSEKKVTVNVTWNLLIPSSEIETFYLSRYLNNTTRVDTTDIDFKAGTLSGTQVTKVVNGEVKLANNNRAKWCEPAFATDADGNEVTITLPDGPPVAVAAYASATSSAIPNNVFVATAPQDSNSVKMAFANVTANTDVPVPTLRGTFTLDPTKYSNPALVPTGINLTNNFKTNDVKYYTSAAGKIYALLATDLPDHEVVVVQVNNGSGDSFQDPVNKIYKYWTFFNTRIYQGNNASLPNQDQNPFGYGAVSIATFGTKGYVLSGGYLYTFDLSNIDTKTPATGLDMIGCRIQLDGYDCLPGSGTDMKYNAGETGASWGDQTPPAHNNCSDGGNIELYADHQMSVATSAADGHTYVFIAVGAGTNPELDIADVTTVPTNATNPKINSNSCGRISGGANGWKVRGSLDFNTQGGTEEAANSVYARADSNRVYMSSNGGIDGNGDGKPDSDQFYIIDTTSKTAPKFLTGTPATGAQSGYYNGNATNIQLFPRRSLTVLSGGRAILVGQDGFPLDGIEPQEYQVLNIENESAPAYCKGLNYLPGFNDLTSVSEADGDNFVYMVANTLEKQLKIIQGGPDDGIYATSGFFESQTFDAGKSVSFNRLIPNFTMPANTNINFQVAIANGPCASATFNYLGPDGTDATFFTATAPLAKSGQCLRYKAYLTSTDGLGTPVLNDMTVNYSP